MGNSSLSKRIEQLNEEKISSLYKADIRNQTRIIKLTEELIDIRDQTRIIHIYSDPLLPELVRRTLECECVKSSNNNEWNCIIKKN